VRNFTSAATIRQFLEVLTKEIKIGKVHRKCLNGAVDKDTDDIIPR
jgi:hypothetical protein